MLVGIAEAVLAFWGTWWLMHPEHKAERMALILSFGRKARRRKEDPRTAQIEHALGQYKMLAEAYKKESNDARARLKSMQGWKIQDGTSYYGQPSHPNYPQPPLILPNAEGLLGTVTPWLRDGVEPRSKQAYPRWAGGVSEKATPEYEAGIKRRAEARRLRAKYGMDSDAWKRRLFK